MDTIGSNHPAGASGTLARVSIGVNVRLQDTDGEDLGFVHLPAPVERGDVVALADGSTWRVVMLIDLFNLGDSFLFDKEDVVRVVDVLCMVEPADLGPAS
jgi:hypothetical protein